MAVAPEGVLSVLRVLVAGIALLLVPGWLLQSLILRSVSLPSVFRLPMSFSLSVGSVAVLGIGCFALNVDLQTAQVLVLIWLACLTAAWVWQARRGRVVLSIFPGRSSAEFWPSVAVTLFAALCAALALYGGGWLSHTADGFYHLAAIRRQIETGSPLPQELFFAYEQGPQSLNVTAGSWHLVLSLFSLWSGVDILWLWWYLPVVVAPLLVLSLYSLASILFRRPWLALFGTLIQFTLYDKFDFRASVYPNQVGFILLWSSLALLLLYLEHGRFQELALIGFLALAMVSWHLLMGEFLIVVVVSYFLARSVVLWFSKASWWGDREIRLLMYMVVPVVLVVVPFVAYRAFEANLVKDAGHWLSVSPRTTFRSSLTLGHGFSIIGPVQLYKVDPRWRFAPFRFAMWLSTYVASLFLVPYCLRRKRFALFLLSTVLVIPLVLLNPFLITYLQGKVSDLSIIRLVLLPPYGLILGWFFWEQGTNWVHTLRGLPCLSDWFRRGVWKSAVGLVLGGAAMTLVGYVLVRQGIDNLVDLYSPTSQHVYSIASTHRQMRSIEQAPYEFLIDHSIPGTVVASDPESSYYLGGLTGRYVIAVPAGHDPPPTEPPRGERRRDSVSIMNPAVKLDETLTLLDKYQACLVWVDSRMTLIDPVDSRRKFESHPDLFELVYSDPDVRIYHYRNHEAGCIR